MKLSVVTTLYRSEPFVSEFCERAGRAASALASDYEIVLVNDGSPDASLECALEVQRDDPHVVVVDLARNFGHHKAMMTGLAYASGDRVLLIDCDLEEPPEVLTAFWEEMDATGADVVFGVQDSRKGGWFERVSGGVFYRFFNSISSTQVPVNAVTARLMRRRYVLGLLEYRDREVFMLGLWALAGFHQVSLPVRKASRRGTSYTLGRRIAVAVNSVTSFTNTPLVFVFYLGVVISLVAAVAALYLVAHRLFIGPYSPGWPSLIVSVWLLGGLTILCLGIIGIYVAKVFSETKRRPYTTVKACYRHGQEEAE